MADTVAVIGLGRVGLPFALFLAERGCTVHGIEVNAGPIIGHLEDHAVALAARMEDQTAFRRLALGRAGG